MSRVDDHEVCIRVSGFADGGEPVFRQVRLKPISQIFMVYQGDITKYLGPRSTGETLRGNPCGQADHLEVRTHSH
jgi:hypothetical protein